MYIIYIMVKKKEFSNKYIKHILKIAEETKNKKSMSLEELKKYFKSV